MKINAGFASKETFESVGAVKVGKRDIRKENSIYLVHRLIYNGVCLFVCYNVCGADATEG